MLTSACGSHAFLNFKSFSFLYYVMLNSQQFFLRGFTATFSLLLCGAWRSRDANPNTAFSTQLFIRAVRLPWGRCHVCGSLQIYLSQER